MLHCVVQVTSGPSKSAKKKAKKKAAAARKADGIENGETEGLEAAGANGNTNHSSETNGVEPVNSNGAAGKKKKGKGVHTQATLLNTCQNKHKAYTKTTSAWRCHELCNSKSV